MSETFQEFDTTTTLTLDPFKEEKKEMPVKQEDPAMDEDILTEEERRTVDAFAGRLI